MFSARNLMEKSREQHRATYIAFVNLSKAFECVDRELLWSVLKRCDCSPGFTELVKEVYEGMKVGVRCGGDLFELFKVSMKVEQGCVIALVLLNVYYQCNTS